jgi:serine O-acetyltransferase
MAWDPGRDLLRSLADYQSAIASKSKIGRLRALWAKVRHRWWSTLTNTDINILAGINPDAKLPHPIGIVIHPEAKIGSGCMIMQQVTIGQLASPGAPQIGHGVYIGAGAKVLGKITVGDNSAIGANAVVLCDVPPGCTAVGVPAVVRPSKTRVVNE